MFYNAILYPSTQTVTLSEPPRPQTLKEAEEQCDRYNRVGEAVFRVIRALSSPANLSIGATENIQAEHRDQFMLEAGVYRKEALSILSEWLVDETQLPDSPLVEALHNAASEMRGKDVVDEPLLRDFVYIPKHHMRIADLCAQSPQGYLRTLATSYQQRADTIPAGSVPVILPTFRSLFSLLAEMVVAEVLRTIIADGKGGKDAHVFRCKSGFILRSGAIACVRHPEEASIKTAFAVQFSPTKDTTTDGDALTVYSGTAYLEMTPERPVTYLFSALQEAVRSFLRYITEHPETLRFDLEA